MGLTSVFRRRAVATLSTVQALLTIVVRLMELFISVLLSALQITEVSVPDRNQERFVLALLAS